MAHASVRYLLDTNICIYIAKSQPPVVRRHFERHALGELAMSAITVGELRFGAEKSQARDRALATIERLVQTIQPCAVPVAAAEHYGDIRASLHRLGQPIGNNDLWLAAHARAEGWVLVTHNTRELTRVPGLRLQDWAQEPTPR